jgi:hypothetical protein
VNFARYWIKRVFDRFGCICKLDSLSYFDLSNFSFIVLCLAQSYQVFIIGNFVHIVLFTTWRTSATQPRKHQRGRYFGSWLSSRKLFRVQVYFNICHNYYEIKQFLILFAINNARFISYWYASKLPTYKPLTVCRSFTTLNNNCGNFWLIVKSA